MAKEKKAARKPAMSEAEKSAQSALDAFLKKHEGKTLTDALKGDKKALQDALGKLKFVRLANARIGRALKAIGGMANLGGKQYVKTDAQVKAICDALDSECKAVRQALTGSKEKQSGFSLPGFEDAPQK